MSINTLKRYPPNFRCAVFLSWLGLFYLISLDSSRALSNTEIQLFTPFAAGSNSDSKANALSWEIDRGPRVELEWQDVPMEENEVLNCSRFKELVSGRTPKILQVKPIDDLILSNGEQQGNHLWPTLSPDGRYLSYISLTRRMTTTWLYGFESRGRGQIKGSETTQGQGRGITGSATGFLSRLQRRGKDIGSQNRPASDIAWSGNSRYYAFVSAGKIFIGIPSVPIPYMLLDGKAYIAYPRWSPDNQQLVYSSGITGNGDLYRIVNLQSQISSLLNWEHWKQERQPKLQQLTNQMSGEELFATWGKQPNYLIYQQYSGGDHGYDLSQLNYLKEDSPSIPEPLKKVYDQIYPKMSPDGTALSFYYNRFKTEPRNVANEKLDKFALFTKQIQPGQLLSFQGSDDLFNNQVTVSVVIDAQKGPLWSPDSQYLIYIADNAGEKFPVYATTPNLPPYQNNEQLTVNDQRLTSEKIVNCTAVDLAETGKLAVIAAQKGTQQRLYLATTNFRSPVD